MAETTDASLHIQWTRYSDIRMPVIFCRTCKAKRRVLACFQDWYGWAMTCLTCGERWADGERLERPFARGWRQKSVAAAKATWAHRKELVERG